MNLIKKVSIVLLCIIVFSFCMPVAVHAIDGGRLLDPILSLLVGLGDGAMTLLQNVTMGIEDSLIELNTSASFWSKFIVIATAVVIAAVFVASLYFSGGMSLAFWLGAAKTVILIGGFTALTFPLSTALVKNMLPDNFYLPVFVVSPQEIFSDEIPLLDVDFFHPSDSSVEIKSSTGDIVEVKSTASILQSVISKWYKILRDIAVIALLSILVYIGIRILISSTSNDKAKYKQMLMDWIVAMCLLFIMQYIMSFSNIFVGKITDVVSSMNNTNAAEAKKAIESKDSDAIDKLNSTSVELFYIDNSNDDDGLVKKAWNALIDEPIKEKKFSNANESPYYQYFLSEKNKQATTKDEAKVFIWPTTNSISQVRVRLQLLDGSEKKNQTTISIGYKLIYIVLVIFTFIFLFTYVKRVIYMAFLTMIAPLVAMTYPIDKINDGKAQAFDRWLKEYIFNLLIQPLHLLLYTILIGSAMDLVSTSPIYVIFALGFMVPAEKLMRKFFGFEKADTPGMLAGPAGAGMIMAGMNKLFSKGPKDGRGKDGSGKNGKSDYEKDDGKVKTHKNFDTDETFGANALSDKNGSDNDNGSRINALSDKNDGNDENNINTLSNNSGQQDKNYGVNLDGSSSNLKGMNSGEEPENQFIEDKIWNNIKDSTPYQKVKGIKDSVYEKSKGAIGNNVNNAKNWVGQRKIIRGIKNLPNKSRVVNSGVNMTKKLAKAGGRVTRFYARGMRDKISHKINNAHLGKRAIRLAGGAVLGATAGTVGLAAGIASGDVSKAFQYTTAGTMSGYKLGTAVSNKALNDFSVEGAGEVFKENYYGKDEYVERQIQQNIRQKQNDLELKWKLEDKFGKKTAKKYMKDFIPDAENAGIDDNSTIAAMIEMQEKKGYTGNEAIAAALISERDLANKDYNTKSAKSKKEFEDTIRKRGMDRSLEGEMLKKFVDKNVKAVKDLDESRYK